MTDEIKPEDVKLPEPVACFVEPELGVMLWPIGDIHEARLYCDEGQEPGLLFTADQVRAAVLEERERAAKVCEELRDLREEVRAILQASKSLKDGDAEETLRRLRHESDVRLHNGALDRAAAAIRSGHSITETQRAEE